VPRRTCQALAAAYHAGELSWLQTLTLAPVVAHVPAKVAAGWIARARRVTLRRLTDEVAWVLARRDAGEPGPYPPPPLDADLRRPPLASDLRREQDRQIGARSAGSTEPPGHGGLARARHCRDHVHGPGLDRCAVAGRAQRVRGETE
jgi:hypothetical protein